MTTLLLGDRGARTGCSFRENRCQECNISAFASCKRFLNDGEKKLDIFVECYGLKSSGARRDLEETDYQLSFVIKQSFRVTTLRYYDLRTLFS